MGKPIIATDVPGCREVVVNGKTGLLVPMQDPKSLADAILSLLENPALAVEMGEQGRALVEQEFSVDSVVSRTLDVYTGMGIVA